MLLSDDVACHVVEYHQTPYNSIPFFQLNAMTYDRIAVQ